MKGQLGDLFEKAQIMKASVKKAQEALADMAVTGVAGAGLVKVTISGRYYVKQISIDPAALSEDKAMLEDLIAAAFNDAVSRAEKESQGKMTGLLNDVELARDLGLMFDGVERS